LDRRIVGLENEYGVTLMLRGKRMMSPDQVAKHLFGQLGKSNIFRENGARIYLDVGAHPEYATPECDNLIELVAHEKAGERILERLMVQAEREIHESGTAGSIYIFKNNTDSAGNTYGCHENYLVMRSTPMDAITGVMIPFFISRQIACGAGKVLHGDNRATFVLSQRAEHIWEAISSTTTQARPVINLRDEAHAREAYRRLHIIVGDANMNEATTFLKVASAHLVLRLIEEGVTLPDFTLDNPVQAIRQVSADMSGRRKVRLAKGGYMSALEMQSAYLDKAMTHVARKGSDPITDQALDLWARTLRGIGEGDIDSLAREIDWATKFQLLEAYRSRHGLAMGHPRVAEFDLAFHDIKRDRGVFYKAQAAGRVDRITSDAAIDRAANEPPQTTRAKLRGDFVRRANLAHRTIAVDWQTLKVTDGEPAGDAVKCSDPFVMSDKRVDDLIATL